MALTSSAASQSAQWPVFTSFLVRFGTTLFIFLDIAGGNASSRAAEMNNTGISIVTVCSLKEGQLIARSVTRLRTAAPRGS